MSEYKNEDEYTEENASGVIAILGGVQALLILFKVTETIIWPWSWIFSPTWIFLVVSTAFVITLAAVLIFGEEEEDEE